MGKLRPREAVTCMRSARRSGLRASSHSRMPLLCQVLGCLGLCGFQDKGELRGRQVAAPWGLPSKPRVSWGVRMMSGLGKVKAARSSTAPEALAMASWALLTSRVLLAHPLSSLQWNNSAPALPCLPDWAQPLAFPKCQCGCPVSRPLSWAW